MHYSFNLYANLFICIFILIPCFSNSCLHKLPCTRSTEINPPFFLSDQTNHSCNSNIKVGCVDNIPTVYPFNHSEDNNNNTTSNNNNQGYKLELESISYESKSLVMQDPYIARFLKNSKCESFLFNLSTNLFTYEYYLSLNGTLSSINCYLTTQNPSPTQPSLIYNETSPTDCAGPKNASFLWFLSFDDKNGSLFVLSASFSNVPSFLSECAPQGAKQPTCQEPPCEDRGTSSRLKIILIGVTVAGALAFIVTCCIFIIKLKLFSKFLRKYNTQESIETILEKYGSLAPTKYKYSELKKITSSFRDKLGKGGFGTVYKGIKQNGLFVAVKFLHNSTNNGEEFINEVISIGRTSHVNVVNLLGFCVEGSKQVLVYEYMANGSLDKYIYAENPKTTLGWEKLYEIAIGIARGLEYLHSGCSTHIVHFDIKPQNILLDGDFNPKIADFGLAKLYPPKESILSSVDMRGTIGFIAPEVFSRSIGVVSTKSDVYSFGMLILEMVGGRKNAKTSVQNSSQVYFPHWIYDHIVQNGEIRQACDVTNETEEIARKMALVGLWCTQVVPSDRPSMSKVLEMLERNLHELETPPKPYFNSPSPTHQNLFSSDLNLNFGTDSQSWY